MASYYYNANSYAEPFTFETIGIHWEQNEERVTRLYGYPFYHYLQSDEGCGQFEVDGQSYQVNEGEGILFAPYLRHSYWASTPRWVNSFITFTGKLESTIPTILNNRKVIIVKQEQYQRISALLQEIIQRYCQFPGDTQTISIECYHILMEFTRQLDTQDLKANSLYNEYVMPVLKIIETDYASRLTAQELSQRVYITPQYLSRLFLRFLGCSVYEYLLNYRIAKAKELLRFGYPMEIQQIAQKVGFDTSSHFIEMFKKRVGVTPYRFREQYTGNRPYLHPDHWRE